MFWRTVLRGFAPHVGWVALLAVLVTEGLLQVFAPNFGHHAVVVAVGLGTIAATFLGRFLESVEAGDPPALQRSWGGLGGGVGGWRMSLSLVYFLGAFFFGGFAGVLVLRDVESTATQAAITPAVAGNASTMAAAAGPQP
jgi:hypothetical protein